jgi:hypothetical protein
MIERLDEREQRLEERVYQPLVHTSRAWYLWLDRKSVV